MGAAARRRSPQIHRNGMMECPGAPGRVLRRAGAARRLAPTGRWNVATGAAAQPPDAEPVETVSHVIARPGGAEEMLTDTMGQSNR